MPQEVWKKYPLKLGKLDFPKDEAQHLALMEWWYGNFHLKTSSGHLYTFMVAYFKTGLRMVALGDITRKNYKTFTDQGFIYARKDRHNITHFRIGEKDKWYQKKGLPFTYYLNSTTNDIELELDMDSQKPPLPIGGEGYVELGTSGSSYYYSLTRLKVDGRLKVDKKSYPVSGLGWIDHQFGHFHPTLSSRGYEWFSIQLDNNHEVICYYLYEKDKPTVKLLNISDTDGRLHNISDFNLTPIDFWVSPHERNFARKWQITCKDKRYPLNLIVETALDDQLINFLLYEGRTNVFGEFLKEKVSGVGFAELSHAHSFRCPFTP